MHPSLLSWFTRLSAILVAIAGVLLGAAASAQTAAPELQKAIATGWEYRWGDETAWHPLGELHQPPDRKGRTELWQRVKLPDVSFEGQALFLHELNHVGTATVGDRLVYRYGDYRPGERLQAPGLRWHMIPLPEDGRDQYLVLHSYSDDVGYIGPFGYVGVGSPAHHLTVMIRRDLDRVVVAALSAFSGLLAWIVYFRKRRPSEYLYLTLFALVASLYVLCRAEIRTLLWPHPAAWMRLEFESLAWLPVFVQLHCREVFHARFKTLLSASAMLCAGVALAAMGLDAAGVVPIYNALHYLLWEMVGICAFMLVVATWSILDGLIEAKIMTVGVALGGVMAVQSTLASLQILPWEHHLSHWAILLIVLSLGIILIRRFILTYYEVEGNLKERDERLSAILDALPDSMLLTARDGSVLMGRVLPGDAAVLAPEGLGPTLQASLPPRLTEAVRDTVDQLAERLLSVQEVDLPEARPATSYEIRITPAGPDRFLALLRDISERRRLERMSREFVAMVSHELRTPLTVIKGTLSLLAATPGVQLPPRLGALVVNALENSNRLVTLVNDLLDSQKIEAGFFTIYPQPLQVGTLIERVLTLNRPFAERRDVELVVAQPVPELAMHADLDRLIQALTNLISNAVKFSPVGTQVVVRCEPLDDECVRFSVEDHGPGVPTAFRERIFEKFSQADSSDTRTQQGTGLGLNITRAIIDHHGGSVGFESHEGTGSIFYFDLPLRAPDPAELRSREATTPSA